VSEARIIGRQDSIQNTFELRSISPSVRARQPFFGEISSRFEFSKARSGLFEFLLLKFQIDDLMK